MIASAGIADASPTASGATDRHLRTSNNDDNEDAERHLVTQGDDTQCTISRQKCCREALSQVALRSDVLERGVVTAVAANKRQLVGRQGLRAQKRLVTEVPSLHGRFKMEEIRSTSVLRCVPQSRMSVVASWPPRRREVAAYDGEVHSWVLVGAGIGDVRAGQF
jgi:hypothetical protein